MGRILRLRLPESIIFIDGKLYINGKYIPPIRGGVAMYDPEFTRFRIYDDDAGEATSAPLENQDVDHTLNVDSDVEIQLRMFAQNRQAAGSTDDWRIDYDKKCCWFCNCSNFGYRHRH